jgi:hypothetical protein
MTQKKQPNASRLYAEAYSMHYTDNDLRKAFELYKTIIINCPNTKEAGYAESQIQLIVNKVVPKEERLSLQMDMASARFAALAQPDTGVSSPVLSEQK